MADRKEYRSQKDMFGDIWNERPHACEECGRYLNEPKAHNFAHILPKGKYPEFKLVKKNIRLLCLEHHQQYDFGDRKSMKIWDSNQKIIQELNESRRNQ